MHYQVFFEKLAWSAVPVLYQYLVIFQYNFYKICDTLAIYQGDRDGRIYCSWYC